MYSIKKGQSLVLASGSPRRHQMLLGLGLDFKIVIPAIDELQQENETAEQLVQRLALQKALTVAGQRSESWVVAADTVVVLDQQVLGKPSDPDDACQMLSQLAGQWHQVLGGVALVNQDKSYRKVAFDSTAVKLLPLEQAQISAYVASGEPFGKAGAYAIQGLAGHFVEQVSGSYTNVVGLNLSLLVSLLMQVGVLEVRGELKEQAGEYY